MSSNSPEIRFVGELRRCDVKPGDRFVLTTDRLMRAEEREHLQEAWSAFMGGDENKLLVLPPGHRLGVLGGDEPAIEPGLTEAEQKAQAARCACKGSDDLCPCQNEVDEQTRAARAEAQS